MCDFSARLPTEFIYWEKNGLFNHRFWDNCTVTSNLQVPILTNYSSVRVE